MSNSKKLNVSVLISYAIMLVAVILAVVGLFVAWSSASATVLGNTKTTTTTLSEWAKSNKELIDNGLDGYKGYGVMTVFVYLTLAATALTTIVYTLSKFMNNKVLKLAFLICGLLALVFGIVAIALSVSFVENISQGSIGSLASSSVKIAAGPVLILISGILSCIGALWATIKG